MKHQWFSYAISQLIKKKICDNLLLILIIQWINQFVYTSPSQCSLDELHCGIAGRQRRPGNAALQDI